ncbi:hypothetical protein POM88_049959 [Heracleum sosnowskyi]|uniref:SWIM-type domain-containing protein n=1 Tax=Heracleum sosnowskyi TaxID=360622 RepID=A0AAD8M267_9APIA|nr:hypothetical protein POM88_049959 [Heracleum sosnowskyi]
MESGTKHPTERTMDNESVTARNNTIDAEGNREASPDVEVQHEIQRNIWIPHCNEEIKPYKKQVFPDLDTAFEYYKDYGRECGFTVRRSTEKTNNAGKTILKYFVCSRAGPNDYSKSARVSFDATYRTNRYNMVFVPLIGIDNHWKSVIFAGALLESESSENFTWYCESYKKIFGKDPKCIITDQCAAMKIAIENCFPLVKHWLCMWHIMKKLPAGLGTLFCVESPFMDKLRGVTSQDYIKVGKLQLFFFSHFVQKGDTLSEFYLCYESAIERQRYNNKKLNHTDDIMPRPISKKKIEMDAAEMYTRTMFYRIQEEILAGGGDIEIESWNLVDGVKTILIKDPISLSKSFEISLNLETQDIDCSCKMFMRIGYLCSHAFFFLGISGIHHIPRQYVSNRWLKKAEERFSMLDLGDIPEPMSREKAQRQKAKDCWFEFQGCISSASGNQDHIDYIHKVLKLMGNNIKLSQRKGNSRLDDESVEDLIGSKIVEETTILPPNQSNNKGCRKRITSSAEKSIGGKRRQMREYKTCKKMAYHDSRNCPTKNNTD